MLMLKLKLLFTLIGSSPNKKDNFWIQRFKQKQLAQSCCQKWKGLRVQLKRKHCQMSVLSESQKKIGVVRTGHTVAAGGAWSRQLTLLFSCQKALQSQRDKSVQHWSCNFDSSWFFIFQSLMLSAHDYHVFWTKIKLFNTLSPSFFFF